METYILTAVDFAENTERSIAAEVYDKENITVRASVGGTEITGCDSGYFAAFQKFRDELLRLGFGIKCCGARLNAVQSGMMSGCSKIYLVNLGRPAAAGDIADIFDYAEISCFPDTAGQGEFAEKWFGSLEQSKQIDGQIRSD